MIARDTVIFDGDSITAGALVEPTHSRPSLTTRLLARPIRSINVGVNGETIIGRLINFEKNITANYDQNAKSNIVSLLIGTNDLVGCNYLPTVTWDGIADYCRKARTLGLKIALGTLLPRGVQNGRAPTAEQYANMQALNNSIRKSAGEISDVVIDYASHPVMGQMSSVTDTTLYIDGLHPSALGYSHMAALEALALNSLLA